MSNVSYGTIGLSGTITSLISTGGGNNKQCYISVAGAGMTLGTTATVTSNGLTVSNGQVILLDNTNNIYAVGTAGGTISYWSQLR